MPRWEAEESDDFGTLHVLAGQRVVATVREDVERKVTVLTLSTILPPGEIDSGKRLVERVFGALDREVRRQDAPRREPQSPTTEDN